MPCRLCGRAGHNRATCPDAAAISKRCQCCGQYGYTIVRSSVLDACSDCQEMCCYVGHRSRSARKPRVCQVLGQPAYWTTKEPPADGG